MVDFIEAVKEYGLGAAAVAGLVSLVPWVRNIDNRSRETKQGLENVHTGCHIPQGAFKDLRADVDDLKETDHALDNRFTAVETSLERIGRIEDKMDQVIMYLTKKGIDG